MCFCSCSFPVSGGCTCWGVYLPKGVYLGGGVPAQRGVYLLEVYLGGGTCLGVYLLEGCTCPGGVPRGVPCDLSHHTFDVTCMLSCHQLRLITSAAAYIVFGHVTCGACWDTAHPPPPPVDRMTDTCKNITFANFVWWTVIIRLGKLKPCSLRYLTPADPDDSGIGDMMLGKLNVRQVDCQFVSPNQDLCNTAIS